MNRLLSAAQHYVECATNGLGFSDTDAARRELIEAARDAYLATLAAKHDTPFHNAAHARVERAEREMPPRIVVTEPVKPACASEPSIAQLDIDDYHGRMVPGQWEQTR